MPVQIATSTAATATAYSNQRKIDRCSNGVLWTVWDNGGASPEAFYSIDDGATWVSGGVIDPPMGIVDCSLFIDVDDYAHLVWKQQYANSPLTADYIYYRRGTPNAGRTAWTWSAATRLLAATTDNYLDLVAHREGTGWKVHVVSSYTVSPNTYARYGRIGIDSGGTISVEAALGAISTNGGNSNSTWPSIDFHHTGDGKTVQGGTPHLYVGWSAGATGSGKGIRFLKATYSGGSWTWGAEREIDPNRFWNTTPGDDFYFLNCLFDGTRVIIAGALKATDNGYDIMLYERDAADTTTTTRLLQDGVPIASQGVYGGSLTYDSVGNVYFFGRTSEGSTDARNLVYRKWTRATATLGGPVVIESTARNYPYPSVKRGYSNNRIEFIYTDGTASPYNVNYDSIELPKGGPRMMV